MDEPGDALGGRAQRALALMGIAAVALAVAAGLYLHATGTKPPPPPPPALTSLDWLSPTTGWVVLTDRQSRSVLFHTEDGGRHWERQFATVAAGISVRFLDARHGLMTEPPAFAGASQTLLRSDDGGDHWAPIALPFGVGTRSVTAFFLDLDHGWVVAGAGRSDTVEDAEVYRTDNGGLDWTSVASVDPISWVSHGLREQGLKQWLWFRTPLDGWLGSLEADGSASVYVTHDGGEHWRWSPLPVPPGGWSAGDALLLEPPRVSQAGDGALMLVDTTRLVPPPSDRLPEPRVEAPVVVYQTLDGGETWRDPAVAPAGADPRVTDPLFVDAADGWLTAGGAVWLTADAGRTWDRHSRLPPGRLFGDLAPVDSRVAVAQSSAGRAPGSDWSLVVTEDAGRTWRELSRPQM
ncbi:MAG TPA: hypothetical protein VOB72_13275 [Candidatus Dormibacteraeota bacterium]|nr:hypothetical protein [Candidatus Dormibacteraeota bacterium]